MAAEHQVFREEKILNEAMRLDRTGKVGAQHTPRLFAFPPRLGLLDSHAVLREQPDAVDYLVLGDTTILIEEPAGIRVVTDDRLEHVAAVQHGAMHEHATGSADHARSFAELVTEQRRHRNHPDGFWVASTDPTAAQHALTDTVSRDGLRRAAVLSDGATRLVDRFGLLDWPGFLDVLAGQGPDAIIAQVRAAEHSDPDGQRWPRGKRHDDASAAFCQLT